MLNWYWEMLSKLRMNQLEEEVSEGKSKYSANYLSNSETIQRNGNIIEFP